jgi:hypothetical protein
MSTLLVAEAIVASTGILAIFNVWIQEKIGVSFPLSPYKYLRNLLVAAIVVHLGSIGVFRLGCENLEFRDFVLTTSRELDFCGSLQLQINGMIFLGAISIVVTLLFGFGRIYEKHR